MQAPTEPVFETIPARGLGEFLQAPEQQALPLSASWFQAWAAEELRFLIFCWREDHGIHDYESTTSRSSSPGVVFGINLGPFGAGQE